MESWNSEWTGDLSSQSSVEPALPPYFTENINYDSLDIESPHFSEDSKEGLSELAKSDKNIVKPTLINTSLAKKRLQAYSKHVNKIPIKEEKGDPKEKHQDISFKKKKDYPFQKSKAVIQEIEEIKRKELEHTHRQLLMTQNIQYLHSSEHSIDGNQQFRRRGIKQRNYRRTDSTNRKSISPEVHHRNKSRPSPTRKYPKDWSEYNANRLIISQNDKSNSKKYSKNRSVSDLLENLYNFQVPSSCIESFKCETENGTKEVSPFFLKLTKSKPPISYSVNWEKIKESYLTRDQLFSLVPEIRQKTIKSVITTHSKSQPLNKKIESKSWYSKTWRKHSDAECKVLENSVGLSFLQTYSDEEEEIETEEILICSSINNAKTSNTNKNNSYKLKEKVDKKLDQFIVIPDNGQEEILNKDKTNLTEPLDESGFLTPEIPQEFQKNSSIDVSVDVMPEELTKTENRSKEKPRKKKKSKKKAESKSKNKKKKKKRKNETSDEESVDSNNKKKETKKLKKTKTKTEDKPIKLKTEKKQSSSKVLKPKKKSKIAEQLEMKKKRAKKNKKEAEHIETKSPLVDNIKKLKKQFKKTKLAGSNNTNSEENKKKPEKSEKNIDLIAINKSYRPSLDVVKDLSHEKKAKKHDSPERKSINKSLKAEFEDFPLEKDISELAPKVKTPDTEEYRGNWEKDSFESEGENMYNKPKLNSSWESDEELYERQERPNEHSRIFTEVSNLEIPLNIKPFKKRDLEFDIKLDTEEKKLDILEKKLDIPEKKLDIKEKKLDFNFETAVKKIQSFDFDIEPIEITPSPILEKKRRWDKTEKESTPIHNIKPPDLNNYSLNSSTALENEYVEFMKAVTSNTNSNITSSKIDDSIIYLSSKIDDSIISLSSNESIEITSGEIVISPKDIPFIPMPDEVTLVPDVVTDEIIPEPDEIVPKLDKVMPELDEIMPEFDEIKPVPVPCPTLDIIPKHLISFNISGKIDSPKIIKMNLLENQENLVDSSTQSTGEDFNCFSINLETECKDVEAKDTSPKKPFSFTTLVLPSKKALLDNSNLKLGDSDDDTDKALKPIEEIRKELIIDTNTGENLLKEETLTNNAKVEDPEEKEKTHRRSRSISPPKSSHSQEIRKPKEKDKRESSPRRNRRTRKRESSSLRRRSYSPKRGSSPKRRRKSPDRYRDRRRKSSVGSRRYSSRRSPSPRRKSPRRSLSPRQSISPRSRLSTKSSIKSTSRFISNIQPPKVETQIQKSPTIASPLEGLKKSVADSTISDDSLLPQPNLEEYTQSPIPQFFNRPKPKRMSLEDRINLEMGWNKEEPQPISTTYGNFYNQNQFSQDFSSTNIYPNTNVSPIVSSNLVQIVPQDMTEINTPPEFVHHRSKSKILQVGNMLQIVPADLPPEIPLPPLPSPPPIEEFSVVEPAAIENESVQFEKEDTLSEHRADREKRKVEREARRKEKENRRREKEKQRNIKMKQKTENMIMRALQLEIENNEEVENELNDSTVQWPPLPNICTSKDLLNKSILVQGQRKINKGKNVQFADGIRPGEGTSPSAGEDLCSSPPTKVLPKEKRYTKTKLRVRNVKKKVKVKIIKPNADLLQSDEYDENEDDDDYLPPPSPPPGSPPPHIYPPRVKTMINNIHAYVSNVSQTVYSSSVNPLMATQSLPHLQQLHMGGQPQPPMADPHVQVHHLAHYQVPALTATAPPPPPPPLPIGSSAIRKRRRRPDSQRYKKY